MHVLAGLSRGSSQGGSQQLLALGWALEEELHDSRQHGQLHLSLLIGKAPSTCLKKIRGILQGADLAVSS